ncbi:TonB-dependent receptor family protein [Methylocystis parvus]|uniref:TonB-dependent receptor n=1 Tax=Methylocystis parvus TaxID=134 RepID=A0A6B8MBP0_9HYPH|nr:TonB-dependent receptor [Methylocystis parvus]QGM99039.1 TonB-dependent receptor [Methylocystis parvus]WBK00594.1 TonB-dependent receptor [Methylocystis parvus OBBP]
MFRLSLRKGASALALVLAIAASDAIAQQNLPTIDVGQANRPQQGGPRGNGGGRGPATRNMPAAAQTPAIVAPGQSGSLTVPSVAQLRRELNQNVGSVAFVDANTPEIKTRYVHDLRDALKDVPGVYVETRYGQELRLSIRGSNLTRDYHLRGLELLQDGIPMNFADGGGDMYQIDPSYFRAIEVFKGGNGLAYGSSTLGGAVNFISPTAYTALSPNLFALDVGAFGTIRGQAQASRVFGDFDALINGTFTHSDGYRGHSTTDYTQINGNIGYRFSKDLETRFYFGIYDTWQQLPGTLELSVARQYPTIAMAPYPAQFGIDGFGANQARNVQNFRISNKTTIDAGFGKLDLNAWYIHNYLYHPIFVVIEQAQDNWGFAPRFTSTFDVAGHRNDLIAGGRVWGGDGSDKWFTNYNGMKLNPFGLSPLSFISQFGPLYAFFLNPGGLYIPVGADPNIRNNRMNALNLEAYFENRFYVVPSLAFMFGAKYFSDQRNYSILGGIPYEPIPGYDSKTYHGINPKVGVMFEPSPDMQFFADMTGSRDAPDFADLTQGAFPPPFGGINSNGTIGTQFIPLAAQKAWTGEIGARGKWDRYSWDVTYYFSSLSDELLKFNPAPGTGIPSTTFNARHTIHQGVEFGAGVDLLRDLTGPGAGDVLKLTQIWNWNDFRFDGDTLYGNNPLPGIPRHVLRTTLGYSRPDGIYFAPSMDWVPEGTYVDYAHTLQSPGYVLIGLQAGMKTPYGLSFYLDARNLTDRHYISDVTTVANAYNPPASGGWPVGNPRAFYPGNGRAIFTGFKWAF